MRAGELARTCDLIVDHTDTFKGRGLFRAFVRQVLESTGSKIVGSDSRACFLADNKIAAKARLSALGLPVPPGIVISRKNEEIPSWLQPPLILKPAFEHMSRGLKAVQTLSEARSAANELLDSQKQPILIETYIPGREIAVSILDGPDGLQALPLLEWVVEAKAQGILTEAFKLTEPPPNRRDALRADLPPKQREEIQALSQAAFKALGLRDYARFDLRLSEAGQPFFLEANITPSLEPQEALALSASWAGLKYPGLVERMLFSAQKRYGENLKPEEADVGIDLPTGRLTMTVPTGRNLMALRQFGTAAAVVAGAAEHILPPPALRVPEKLLVERRADDEHPPTPRAARLRRQLRLDFLDFSASGDRRFADLAPQVVLLKGLDDLRHVGWI